MPIRSQFRPYLAPLPAAPCAYVQSYRRSATAIGLDHKSPGVREVCNRTSEQMFCAVVVPYQTSQLFFLLLWSRVLFYIP